MRGERFSGGIGGNIRQSEPKQLLEKVDPRVGELAGTTLALRRQVGSRVVETVGIVVEPVAVTEDRKLVARVKALTGDVLEIGHRVFMDGGRDGSVQVVEGAKETLELMFLPRQEVESVVQNRDEKFMLPG